MLYCLMAVTRFVFFILLSLRYPRREEIPQLKAKAGMPVIQELMGDCSLTCAFPWEAVTGTSTFGGGIAALNDADSLTAWTNAQIGDTLIFKFPLESPAGAKRDAVLRSRYCQMGVCIRRAVSRNLAASRRSDFATTTNRCALSVWRTHDADGT
jgi:hypothetical protein